MSLQGCHVPGCSLVGAFELADGYHYCVGHAVEREPAVVLAKTPEQLRYIASIGGGSISEGQFLAARNRLAVQVSGGRHCEGPGCLQILQKRRDRFCSQTCQKRSWRSRQPKRPLKRRGLKRVYASGSDRAKAWRRRKRQAAQQVALEAERRLTPEDLRHKRNAEAFAEKIETERRSRRAAEARRARSAGRGWPPEGEPCNWTEPTAEEIIERERYPQRIDADHPACGFCGKRLQKGESFCDGRCLDAFMQKDDKDAEE